jgi:drug/metabolite transporter (DMT)-like permease
VFVLLWSTGFVVARYAMPHAPPFKFLALRYVLSVLCFAAWVKVSALRLPEDRRQWIHLAVTGVLMHGLYLGGVWSAVRLGLGAGTTALIVGLQPVLTAVWSLGGRSGGQGPTITPRQWCGLIMGFAGMALVVSKKLGVGEGSWLTVGLAVLALAGITAGTLYQKARVRPCDVRVASLLQLSAAAVVTLPLAALESDVMHWHPDLLGALAWSVLALTVGASSMLYLLIQKGAATQVTSLLYLVPPCTAVLAWLLFDEALGALTVLGIAVTVAGVALVTRAPRPAASVDKL